MSRVLRSSALALLMLSGCGGSDPTTISARRPAKIDAPHLPNAYRLHERVISGGQPHGEAGFAELRDLGVRTIISVDGAKPDVEGAKRYGLRYVHLPHGYDGIPEQRARELAKAVREFDAPIYIHCHHGQHRSPAAAGVACVGAGLLSPTEVIGVLHVAGTSKNYRGLYQAAESARRFDDALLDELRAEYPETAELPPLAEAMVEIEHVHDHLKTLAKSGWQSMADHPDLTPPHEALLLKEHFTELLRTSDVRQRPERFQALLRESETAAGELEAALGDMPAAGSNAIANKAFERITANCAACHREFRDTPGTRRR